LTVWLKKLRRKPQRRNSVTTRITLPFQNKRPAATSRPVAVARRTKLVIPHPAKEFVAFVRRQQPRCETGQMQSRPESVTWTREVTLRWCGIQHWVDPQKRTLSSGPMMSYHPDRCCKGTNPWRERMTLPNPNPVTMPSRAHISAGLDMRSRNECCCHRPGRVLTINSILRSSMPLHRSNEFPVPR
jgi:hypothetical protein